MISLWCIWLMERTTLVAMGTVLLYNWKVRIDTQSPKYFIDQACIFPWVSGALNAHKIFHCLVIHYSGTSSITLSSRTVLASPHHLPREVEEHGRQVTLSGENLLLCVKCFLSFLFIISIPHLEVPGSSVTVYTYF